MKEYIQTYLNHYGFTDISFIPCEVCKEKAVDIHHVEGRRGKLLNDPNNLVALCRECHSDQKILNAIKVGKKLNYIK